MMSMQESSALSKYSAVKLKCEATKWYVSGHLVDWTGLRNDIFFFFFYQVWGYPVLIF